MVSTEEEKMILEFLEATPETLYSAMEIGRKAAGKRRFEEDPRWVFRFLTSLVDQRLVFRELTGHYRARKRTDPAFV